MAGDGVYLFLSGACSLELIAELQDMLMLSPAGMTGPRFVGVVPPGGTLTLEIQAPHLAPGVEGFLVLVQSAFLSTGGVPSLGPGTSVVVLDEATP